MPRLNGSWFSDSSGNAIDPIVGGATQLRRRLGAAPRPRQSKTKFPEREIRWHVAARPRGLHETQRLHDAHRHEPEIKFGWIVTRSQKVRIVMMVVLQAGAEGRHDRKPVADIHCIVIVMVAASAEA